MSEMRAEAGELSDGELNMVVGGVSTDQGRTVKQAAEDVDAIQELIQVFTKPPSPVGVGAATSTPQLTV